jgi:alpha-beta hydrolase superfamily lysophospholipase
MDTLVFTASDGKPLRLYRWLPGVEPRATVQIAHGMGEHAGRYDELAGRLADAGYAVYANDHRGHGGSAEPGLNGYMGPDGWNRVISDAAELAAHVFTLHPGVPRVLIGHSMGAMLTQQYLYRYGAGLDAVVLSGTPGFRGTLQILLSLTVARYERWRLGPDAESPRLQQMLFGRSNEAFAGPGATGAEWLSRDPARVAAYAADPQCGFVLRAGSLCDLFAGARAARRRRNVRNIPAHLPLLVLSGSADPVHAGGKNLDRLLASYRRVLTRIDYRLYPDARHELFNETNREAVIQDLLAWLDDTLAVARPG